MADVETTSGTTPVPERNIKMKNLDKLTQLMVQYLQTMNMYHPNMADNSNFQINQRGLSSYTSAESGVYTVDRWAICRGGTVTPQSYGVDITSSGTERSGVVQCTEKYYVTPGETITYSVDFLSAPSSNWEIVLGVAEASSTEWEYTAYNTALTSGINSVSYTLPDDRGAGEYIFQIFIRNKAATVETVSVTHVKLEQSTFATSYALPNIIEERRKCQAYYQISEDVGNVIGTVVALTATTGLAVVNIPVTMRAVPNIAFNNISLIGIGSPTSDNIKLDSVDGDSIAMGANSVSFTINASELVAGANYYMTIASDGYIMLDSDIDTWSTYSDETDS